MVKGKLDMITRADVEYISNNYYLENTVHEMMGLLEHVTAIAPEVIMEIGVCFGNSLRIWEKVLPEGGIAIGVDVNPSIEAQITGERPPGTRGIPSDWVVEESLVVEGAKVLKLRSPREIYIINEDSKAPEASAATKKLLNDRKIDFWFHDGCHYGVGPIYDYANFEDLIRTGGLVCIADTSDPRTQVDNLGTAALWRAFPEPKIPVVKGHTQGMSLWWKTDDFRMKPHETVEKENLAGDDTTVEGRKIVWNRQNSVEAIVEREGLDDRKPNGPKHGR